MVKKERKQGDIKEYRVGKEKEEAEKYKGK